MHNVFGAQVLDTAMLAGVQNDQLNCFWVKHSFDADDISLIVHT
jgi:hypothetical protein